MREPYKKGIASHLGPESCVVSRKVEHEALTGGQAGWAIEPRNGAHFRGPTLSSLAEGNTMGVDNARRPSPGAVEDPRQAWKLNAREPGDPSGARGVRSGGPEGERDERGVLHARGWGVTRLHSTCESPEQRCTQIGGGAGGKAVDRGEHRRGQPEPGAETGNRVTGSGRCAGSSQER
jgi:hypothetical protein